MVLIYIPLVLIYAALYAPCLSVRRAIGADVIAQSSESHSDLAKLQIEQGPNKRHHKGIGNAIKLVSRA